MGYSTSFEQLANKFGTVKADLGKVTQGATVAAAQAAKEVFLTSAAAATGGDLRLSQVGRNGAKLGVNYKIIGKGLDASARIRATGPWHLVEYRLGPHVITSKRAGGSRRSRARRFEEGAAGEGIGGGRHAMLRTPYGPRPFVIHPGTSHPAKPWTRAVPIVSRTTPVVYERAAQALLIKVFA